LLADRRAKAQQVRRGRPRLVCKAIEGYRRLKFECFKAIFWKAGT
jgi:hypothetical protein